MRTSEAFSLGVLVASIIVTSAGAQPAITGLSSSSLDRSERVVVTGIGFGGAPDALLIDGIESWVTQWSDTRIVGYVPEASALGDVDVVVAAFGLESEPATLDVTAREPDGLIRWRFTADSSYMVHRPGIGPDGTVYLNDLEGWLYALSEDGGLLWIVDPLQGQVGSGTDGPVVVGEDATIYVTVNPLGPNVDLVAVNPDGSIKWTYTDFDATSVAAGPAVGPDGNVYIAFQDVAGTAQGAVSLTPDGDVRWTNPGNPALWEHGAQGAEIVFAPLELGGEPGQMIITVDHYIDRRVHAFDMETGVQRFAAPAGTGEAVFLQPQLQPAVGIDGRIIMAEFGPQGGVGWGLQTFLPESGQRDWRFDPDVISGVGRPFVGVDGAIYVPWDLARVSKVGTDGVEHWRHDDDGIHYDSVPSPLNDVLVVPGRDGFGETGWVRGLSIGTGEELFRVDLPAEFGGTVGPSGPPIYTPDGASAYVPCSNPAATKGDEICYLYAIQTGEAGCAADVNGDGKLNILDFVAFQNAFTSGDASADCDANGQLNILDFVCYQNLFSAGCP